MKSGNAMKDFEVGGYSGTTDPHAAATSVYGPAGESGVSADQMAIYYG